MKQALTTHTSEVIFIMEENFFGKFFGQLTYNVKDDLWSIHPIEEMTTEIAQRNPKIQSRPDGYYRAWCGELTNSSESLEELIFWIVEKSY